jgi:iron complex transport system substrate-binding protein
MKRAAIAVLMLTSVLLTACGGAKPAPTPAPGTPATPASPAAGPKTFKTDLGDLTLEKTPTKIVAINLQAIDSLVALGLKPTGYAEPGGEPVTYLGNNLEGATKVGSHSKPSLETIAALTPDLIIIDSKQQADMIPELSKIAPVLGIRSFSYQDSMKELQLLGDITGKRAEADKFVAGFDTKVKDSLARVAGKKGPRVSAIFGTVQKPGLWLKDSFVGSILTAMGAEHAYAGGKTDPTYPDLVYLSTEEILNANPEVLLFMSTPGKEISTGWAENPAFKNTDAVKNNRVHEVDRQAWSRSRGPIAATQVFDQAFPLLYPGTK